MNLKVSQPITIMVTGGAGFIGSNFLRRFVSQYSHIRFVNLDKLTYAGNLESLEPLKQNANYCFEKTDITDAVQLREVFDKHLPDAVFHFAAESHVDRSIVSPHDFVTTNVLGTFNLLEECRRLWTGLEGKLFHHVSTDEVFGSLGESGRFSETTPYDPSSPYSASKAGSDHLVRAYHRTYGLPVTITNCSNNYGPFQFPEKLIPLMILNAAEGKPLPVYGTGGNVRDWLYVEDHCDAIWTVATQGRVGDTYTVGGNCERRNLDVVKAICSTVARQIGKKPEAVESQITFVSDRLGHDFRYAIDASKIEKELGWTPHESFESGLTRTVSWYLANPAWVDHVRSGEYRRWIEEYYSAR